MSKENTIIDTGYADNASAFEAIKQDWQNKKPEARVKRVKTDTKGLIMYQVEVPEKEETLYFTVELKTIFGNVAKMRVDSTGDPLELPDEEELEDIKLAYIVTESYEDGEIFSTVEYNLYGEDEDKVMAQIIADHPAPEWQNNDF